MTREQLDGDYVFALHDFLSAAECEELTRRSRGLSWETGTVGGERVESVRNNERVLFDDPVLAADLFARARPFLPATIGRRPLTGFNERWRFYRYGPGQAFAPHRDGSYMRYDTLEESHLTFMVYLNDGSAGGETRFFAGMQDAFSRRPYLTVAPRAGSALVFIHRLWHEGAEVTAGEKLVLRTDVMYGSPAPSEESDGRSTP